MAKKTIIVDNTQISFYKEDKEDYISLTDIAKRFNERTDQIITNWIRTRATLEFLGTWEIIHNNNFNPLKFEGIKNQAGTPTFVLSTSEWIEQTGAIGIRAKAGRYGGTFAHIDIAFEFLSYLSPSFKLYVIKEFKKFKTDELKTIEWTVKRSLSKANYIIHTDAVKNYLIPQKIQDTKFEGLYYATEADLLNIALFGMTAKQWQDSNPNLKGNMRDNATVEQLLVLANIENLNAQFIKMGLSKEDRLLQLNEISIYQIQLLTNSVKSLKSGKPNTLPDATEP